MQLFSFTRSTALLSTFCVLFLGSSTAATLEKRCPLKRESMTIVDGLLTAEIKIGTPAQSFSVVFDTSNSLTWVPSVDCQTPECHQQSQLYNPLDSKSSVNLHKTEKVKYDEGVCFDARLYKDTVSVAGLSVSGQLFGAAYSVKGLGGKNYLGSFGLGGYSSDGSTNYLTSNSSSSASKRQVDSSSGGFAQNAFQLGYSTGSAQFGMVATSQDGFYQKRNGNGQNKAEFILGGIDHNVYKGKVAYFKLPTCDYGDSPFWKTELSCVKFGDKIDIKLAKKSLASFDTSSSNILAPSKQADLLHAAIDARYDSSSNQYKVEYCEDLDKFPTLEFDFKSYRISLPPKLYLKKEDGSKQCHTLIGRNTNDDKNWVLGGAFLNNFYHIYDLSNSRVGLAIPKGDCDAKIKQRD